MRILTICNLFPPYVQGGNEIRLMEIVERLRQRHEIAVLTSAPPGARTLAPQVGVYRELTQSVAYPEPVRGRSLFLGRESMVSALNYFATRRLIKRFQPDVVYMSDTKRTLLGPAHAAQRAGLEIVWDITDKSLCSYRRRADFRRWVPWSHLDGLSFENSIAISRYIRDALVSAGLLPETARYINQGVDLARFGVDAPRVSGGPARRLLYVGSLIPDKGVHVVLRALARLTSEDKPEGKGGYFLTVCGDSGDTPYKAKLAAFVVEHGLSNRVDFRGRVPSNEAPVLYREHDAFLFSSLWPEPFATTPLEAMASGCPVIGTPVGGQADFFRHDQNCLTYAATSDFELAERIRSLADPAKRLRLAVSALEEVRAKFDFSDYVSKVESVLVKVARDGALERSRSWRSVEPAPDSL